ncbi:hypothetical protein P3W45_000274 [Vairimorpha bombi]|jgi:coatomer subunit beta'
MKLQEQTLKKIRSTRVKAIEIHSAKPICVVGLYNGYLQTWNTSKCTLVNEIQVSDFPIRTLALVEKNNYVLVGVDDGRIYVYEINNLQRLNVFDAHVDFIRKIVVHHTNSEFLTCSDDGTIKLWEIHTSMQMVASFTGHGHFVMDVCYYPKDTKQFLSCSLDGTIKLWDRDQRTCIKTFKGHKAGINSLAFCKDDNYFITGSDDLTVKIWGINNVNCISTLTGHTNNIINVYSMSKLPYLVSCSEDGSYRLWDTKTYENVEISNMNSGRVWQFKEKNNVMVIGTDEELVFKKIKTGQSLVTMKNKKIFFSAQNAVYSCRIEDIYNIKKLSDLDFYPSELNVSENGKFISVSDDKNFSMYSSLGFRKKFSGVGSNFNFITSEKFVVLNENLINIYNKSEICKTLKIQNIENIFLVKNFIVGVAGSVTNVYTFDGTKIFTLNYKAKKVISIGQYMIIEKDNKIQIYKIIDEIISAYLEQELEIDDTGIPGSFVLLKEFDVKINSYCSSGNIFIFEYDIKGYYIILREDPYLYNFTTIGGILGGAENGTIYVINNKKVETIELDMKFLDFQIKTLDGEKCEVDERYRMKAISFYESLCMNDKALEICTNDNQKFEILLKLKRLQEAYAMSNSELMYERVGKEFLKINDLENATECFYKSKNWKSLLFVDLLCNKKYLKEVGKNSFKEGNNNFAFVSYMKLKDYKNCEDLIKDTKFYNIFKKTYLN